MNQIAERTPSLPAMSPAAVDAVRELESVLMAREQIPIVTSHLIHGGMYLRTICLPAGGALTGALLKVPTSLILSGHVTVFTGTDEITLMGHHVIPGSSGRKTAFIAHDDTHMTMCFPTDAKTVEQAEAEFTDEPNLLFSRHGENVITITGE